MTINDEAKCAVAPLAREAARICRALVAIETAEDEAIEGGRDPLPPSLHETGMTGLYARGVLRARLRGLSARAGALVASSAIGAAYQLLALNECIIGLSDEARLEAVPAGGKPPALHEILINAERRVIERLAMIVRAVAPLDDPDFLALEAELLPDVRNDLRIIEDFASAA